MTSDDTRTTMAYVVWREEHIWNVTVLQTVHLPNLVFFFYRTCIQDKIMKPTKKTVGLKYVEFFHLHANPCSSSWDLSELRDMRISIYPQRTVIGRAKYSLTPWSRVLLKKLRVRSASQEIPRSL
jgi:hypothetical protein